MSRLRSPTPTPRHVAFPTPAPTEANPARALGVTLAHAGAAKVTDAVDPHAQESRRIRPGPARPTPLSLARQRITGTRLGGALLAYMLGVTLIITLLPFQFDWPHRWRVMFTGGVVDIVANVFLFVPLGFLYRLAWQNAGRHSALTVLWIGALLSGGIETAQLFESERYTSVLDVATNAAGAWLGALLFDRLATRISVDGALIGRLSLELPLMGLVYLLVPLLWLSALSSGGAAVQGDRSALAVLLGIVGANLLGGMQRHHFGPTRALDARTMGAVAALWYFAGSFPAIAAHPTATLAGAAGVGAVAWWQGKRPLAPDASNRRFEVAVLRSAAPAYGAYLALMTFAPLREGIGTWSVGIGLPGVATEWTTIEILRFLELVAAFTLLGYMVAEVRGRVVSDYRAAFARLARWGTAAALTGELLRGFHAGHGASVVRALLLAASALYGGWLYYLQRAHIMELLGEPRQAPRPSALTRTP